MRILMQQADAAGGGAGAAAIPDPSIAAQAAAVAAHLAKNVPADKKDGQQQPQQQKKDEAPGGQQAAPDKKDDLNPAAFDIASWKPKLPDGVQPFDQKRLTEVHGIVFNDKLSPAEKMQALTDFQVKSDAEQTKAVDDILKQQRDKDFESLKADAEFGGGRLDKTVAEARDVMTYAFGEKGSKLLEVYGLDKHPDIVIPLARIRAVLSEDTLKGTIKAPAAPANDREAQLKAMFPNSYDAMKAISPKR